MRGSSYTYDNQDRTSSDHCAVFELNYVAFGNREDESKLIERIRISEGFIPEFSLIAENDGEIVGHILLSKAKVIGDEKEHEVIVLAPSRCKTIISEKRCRKSIN